MLPTRYSSTYKLNSSCVLFFFYIAEIDGNDGFCLVARQRRLAVWIIYDEGKLTALSEINNSDLF